MVTGINNQPQAPAVDFPDAGKVVIAVPLAAPGVLEAAKRWAANPDGLGPPAGFASLERLPVIQKILGRGPLPQPWDNVIGFLNTSNSAHEIYGVMQVFFGANRYDPLFETFLRQRGDDVIIIENPSKEDVAHLLTKGFFHKPEKVIWHRPVTNWEGFLAELNSKYRRKFKQECEESFASGMTLEKGPITAKAFEEWFRVYQREVGGKPRGRLHMEADWATKKISEGTLGDYEKIFFRNPKTREIIGGAVVSFDKQEGVAMICYIATSAEHRHGWLSLRVFYELMTEAYRRGYHRLSYGVDPNAFGHFSEVGLASYKATLGFVPQAYGKDQLVKSLNTEKSAGGPQTLFFTFSPQTDSEQQNAPLQAVVIGEKSGLHLPRGIVPVAEPVWEIQIPAPLPLRPDGALFLLKAVTAENKMAMVNALHRYINRTKAYTAQQARRFIEASPLEIAAWVVHHIMAEGLSPEAFVAYCRRENILPMETENLPDTGAIWQQTLDGDAGAVITGLARALTLHCHDNTAWHTILGEVAQHQWHHLKPLLAAHVSDPFVTLHRVLTRMIELHGTPETGKAISRLIHVTGLKIAPADLKSYTPRRAALMLLNPAAAVNDPDKIFFDLTAKRFAKPGYVFNKADYRSMNACYVQPWLKLFHHGFSMMHFSLSNYCHDITGKYLPFAESVEEQLGGFLRQLIACTHTQRQRLLNPAVWENRNGPRLSATWAKEASELWKILLPLLPPEPPEKTDEDPEEKIHVVSTLASKLTTLDAVVRMLFAIGADPRSLQILGRDPEDLFAEIYDRATDSQMKMMAHWVTDFSKEPFTPTPDRPVPGNPLKEIPTAQAQPKSLPFLECLLESASNDAVMSRLLSENFDTGGLGPNPCVLPYLTDLIQNMGILIGSPVDEKSEVVKVVVETYTKLTGDAEPYCYRLMGTRHLALTTREREWILGLLETKPFQLSQSELFFCYYLLQTSPDLNSRVRNLLADNLNRPVKTTSKKLVAFFGEEDWKDSDLRPDNGIDHQAQWLFFTDYILENMRRTCAGYAEGETWGEFFMVSEQTFHWLGFMGAPLDEWWNLLSGTRFKNPACLFPYLERMDELPGRASACFQGHEISAFRIFSRAMSFAPAENPQLKPEFVAKFTDHYFPPEDFFDRPGMGALAWYETRWKNHGLKDHELAQVLLWACEKNSDKKLDAVFEKTVLMATELRKKDLNPTTENRLARALKECLESKTLTDAALITALGDFDASLSATECGHQLITTDLLCRHHWADYGYPARLASHLRELTAHPQFKPRHIAPLFKLLLTPLLDDDQKFRTMAIYWVSRLLLSTKPSAFPTLIPLINYWASLTDEAQMDYVEKRIDELATDLRLKTVREQNLSGTTARASRIYGAELAALAQPQVLPSALEDFQKRLLDDFDVIMKADDELKKIVVHQTGAFWRKSRLQTDTRRKLIESVNAQKTFWNSYGVLDLIVRFASFANEEGLAALDEMLAICVDESQCRFVDMEHPELLGKKKTHLDYFGKFEAFERKLNHRGLRPDTLSVLMNHWRSLWYVAKDESGDFITVTHDLERWLKHGDEPVKTCQSLRTKAGVMEADNWNFQFGSIANTDGRPLARFYLPQLKLAEFHRQGKLIARTVLELTTTTDPDPRPALLAEIFYIDRHQDEGRATEIPFEKQIRTYAQTLGIRDEDIYFADKKGHVEKAPKPLPETHRLQRDTFRPAETTLAPKNSAARPTISPEPVPAKETTSALWKTPLIRLAPWPHAQNFGTAGNWVKARPMNGAWMPRRRS